jgi:DNA-binding MarR family transcriptional regulator
LSRKTYQIATIGEEEEPVLVGLRSFPTHKLALIFYPEHRERVARFAADVRRGLGIPVELFPVSGDIFTSLLEVVSKILAEDGQDYEFIVNVTGGDKSLTCAAVSAAFIHGLKAVHIMGDMPVMLPTLKLSYSDMVSETKLEILRAIERAGGVVKSLEELSRISGYGKPLLSHHIKGSESSRGLVDLGLVEVERSRRGRIRVQLTLLGRILLQSSKR